MSSGGSSTSSSILKVDLPGIAQHGKYQGFYKDPPQNCGRLAEEKEICPQMIGHRRSHQILVCLESLPLVEKHAVYIPHDPQFGT